MEYGRVVRRTLKDFWDLIDLRYPPSFRFDLCQKMPVLDIQPLTLPSLPEIEYFSERAGGTLELRKGAAGGVGDGYGVMGILS